ncbi:MAG: hypothetical protein EZS28_052879, partial [Streblomastix strix]
LGLYADADPRNNLLLKVQQNLRHERQADHQKPRSYGCAACAPDEYEKHQRRFAEKRSGSHHHTKSKSPTGIEHVHSKSPLSDDSTPPVRKSIKKEGQKSSHRKISPEEKKQIGDFFGPEAVQEVEDKEREIKRLKKLLQQEDDKRERELMQKLKDEKIQQRKQQEIKDRENQIAIEKERKKANLKQEELERVREHSEQERIKLMRDSVKKEKQSMIQQEKLKMQQWVKEAELQRIKEKEEDLLLKKLKIKKIQMNLIMIVMMKIMIMKEKFNLTKKKMM